MTAASRPGAITLWLGRLYVPAASFAIVMVAGSWLAAAPSFDPLATAQNSRVRFEAAAQPVAVVSRHDGPGVGADPSAHIRLMYIGNSQTLGIMDPQPGDMTSPQWLQVVLTNRQPPDSRPIQVHVASLPNLTMPEFLIRLVAAGQTYPRDVEILLGAVVLEEFRGLGVRDEVLAESRRAGVPEALAALKETSRDLQLGGVALAAGLGMPDGLREGPERSPAGPGRAPAAARAEVWLQSRVERVNLFAARALLHARISSQYFVWRNRLLGVTSTTPRPVSEATYRASLQLVEMALRYARTQSIPVVLYLAPIRPIQPNPNLSADVRKFRQDLPALCRRYETRCFDYVDLVPEPLWTNYPDGDAAYRGNRDFAHFTGAAHKLLAERLLADVGPALHGWGNGKPVAQP